MKHLKLAIFLVLSLHIASTFAQSPGSARDFWFAVPLNNSAAEVEEKTFLLYIQAHTEGAVYVQVGTAAPLSKVLLEGELWSVILPKTVEMHTSSTVRSDVSVHVWADTTDLTMYFLSGDNFSTDGFEVIPSAYWGQQYVVASYSALILGAGVDLPSEFCIVAKEDNTQVVITPSQDIRKSDNASEILHAKGIPYAVTLQKGQSIMYQTVLDLGGSELDLTGTVVTSSKPVGVIGASACPFIPADPYCDHICEMLLPISRWGRTYHTLPFIDRNGGDSFCMIGSKAGQEIFRNGVFFAGLGKHESYNIPDIEQASEWTSNAPFMLVQYINGSAFGGSGVGDPSMVQINPAEHAEKSVTVVIPDFMPGSTQPAYVSYINLIVPTSAVASLKFNGANLLLSTTQTRIPIGSSAYEGIRIRNMPKGAHTITCDSGITVYAYGYAKDASYAWSAGLGGEGKELSSVKHLQIANELRIWPNPAKRNDLFHITLPHDLVQPRVTMIDVLGNTVFETPYSEEGLDLKPFSSGLYTLLLSGSGKTYKAMLILVE